MKHLSDLNTEDMKLFIETKQGMLAHQERLLDALHLLNQIKTTEYCEDNIPFSCEDYFPDAEHYLEKGIWVIEQILEHLDLHGTAITRDHITEVRKDFIFDEDLEGEDDGK